MTRGPGASGWRARGARLGGYAGVDICSFLWRKLVRGYMDISAPPPLTEPARVPSGQ